MNLKIMHNLKISILVVFLSISYSAFPQDWKKLGSDIDGEASGDQFGESVSISSDGSIIAIGAENNDGNGSNSGHVRVYEWNGSAWVQRGIDIDGEASSDYSGTSVSLNSDGSVVAIGAPDNSDGLGRGHVRVYDWNGTIWSQVGSDLDGSGELSLVHLLPLTMMVSSFLWVHHILVKALLKYSNTLTDTGRIWLI